MTSERPTEDYYKIKLRGYLALSEDRLRQSKGKVLKLIGKSNEFYPQNAFNEVQLELIERIDYLSNKSPAFAGLAAKLIFGEN
ncbi:MAG: hypothetical protein Q7S56_00635 [Nanoarchaeota archaeon]|nr:hypothetical protein [Nanoarchaeota archaeon]